MSRRYRLRLPQYVCATGRVVNVMLPDAGDMADGLLRFWNQDGTRKLRDPEDRDLTAAGIGISPVPARGSFEIDALLTELGTGWQGTLRPQELFYGRNRTTDPTEKVNNPLAMEFKPQTHSYLTVGAWRYDGRVAGYLIDVFGAAAGALWAEEEAGPVATVTMKNLIAGPTTLTRATMNATIGAAHRMAAAFDATSGNMHIWHHDGTSLYEDSTAGPVGAGPDQFVGWGLKAGEYYGAAAFEFAGGLPADWKVAVDTMTADWVAGTKQLYEGWRN